MNSSRLSEFLCRVKHYCGGGRLVLLADDAPETALRSKTQ